ncbi:hypothetical protein ASG47_03610 [Devosia sp. Leaf420]|uniref:TadE/TadG family type IV pilus assembly protein n=1 Tax=Devosia sp. Leaf420 TaxID=1736374 RepID=UPI0007141F10|nr:TadE/TadG family type IV pilus assembly protein [Devosia sp. Leaf420]KQT49430.1 hypothetical protein ASG47_03610 [Devosia sp. Leaf420]
MGKLMKYLRRFIRKETGTAAVEFALVVPLMLTLYLGSSEAAALLTADRKVQTVSGAVGDLVARANKTITSDQMKDYFDAATSIMTPYVTTGLTQTVTAVSVSSTGQTTVLWSVRFADGRYSGTVADHPKGQPYTLPAETIAIAKGQTVIASEARYAYKPLLGLVFTSTFDLNRSALFMPRFGGRIDLM